MQPLTYSKAWSGGLAAGLIAYLATIAAGLGYPMPDSLQSVLIALVAGLVVYLVPNADPKPTEADRIKELEAQLAKLQAKP